MKKIILFFLLFFISSTSYANNNIVYLDIQYIIDNSDLGLSYKKIVNSLQNQIKIEINSKQKIIKEKEIDINNKKNILKKDELNKNLIELDEMVKNYKNYRNDSAKKIIEEKNKYSSKILEILNPLLTKFVETNNIVLVLEKKNILVGAKSLDITENILVILNEETKKKKLLDEIN